MKRERFQTKLSEYWMNENKVVETIKAHIEKQFPKECPNCNYLYKSLKEYLLLTDHIGNPISYDADLNDWEPEKPIGTYSFSNCRCGNTLSLNSDKMKLTTMLGLLIWAKYETCKRGISTHDLLAQIREKIDKQVLSS